VPAARHGDLPLWEGGAIMEYLLKFAALDSAKFESKSTPGAPPSPASPLQPPEWTQVNWARHQMYSYWSIVTLDEKLFGFGSSRLTNSTSASYALV